MGDQFVQVLEGSVRLTILAAGEKRVLELHAGIIAIVPRGQWYKFHAPGGVALLTVTPEPTDHSAAAIPPESEEFAA